MATLKLPSFSNYLIYPDLGKVFSLKLNKFIGAKRSTGYWQVYLMDDKGIYHYFLLHRLIYMAVNGEIPNDMQVNHIDEDKNNNSIINLNLMTPKENCNYGTRNERLSIILNNNKKKIKSVSAYKNGKLYKKFISVKDAVKCGYNGGNISRCCNGYIKHYKGLEWKYN
jgi:hypothetical protein